MLAAALFPVLVASLRLGLEGGLATAVPITFAYGVSAMIDPEFYSLEHLYRVGVNALALLGVAFVSGLLYRQQRASQEEMEQEELQSLRRANERAKAIYEMASTLRFFRLAFVNVLVN